MIICTEEKARGKVMLEVDEGDSVEAPKKQEKKSAWIKNSPTTKPLKSSS